MNRAESDDISRILRRAGYLPTLSLRDSDLIVVNTCVVRQNAEDKVRGMLNYLKGLKATNPSLRVVVTGCFVDSNAVALYRKFPQVGLFFRPGDYASLLGYLELDQPAKLDIKTGAGGKG
jgi:tRNA-2-methylthio-N6-dimethylallyladenosine synthase